jgi:hypothetical protein
MTPTTRDAFYSAIKTRNAYLREQGGFFPERTFRPTNAEPVALADHAIARRELRTKYAARGEMVQRWTARYIKGRVGPITTARIVAKIPPTLGAGMEHRLPLAVVAALKSAGAIVDRHHRWVLPHE